MSTIKLWTHWSINNFFPKFYLLLTHKPESLNLQNRWMWNIGKVMLTCARARTESLPKFVTVISFIHSLSFKVEKWKSFGKKINQIKLKSTRGTHYLLLISWWAKMHQWPQYQVVWLGIWTSPYFNLLISQNCLQWVHQVLYKKI